MRRVLFSIAIVTILSACNQAPEGNTHVKLETTHGDIIIELFDETPGHRDNFIKLVNDGFYDGILFHRIVPGFVIQTGDPRRRTSYNAGDDVSDLTYTIEAEIVPGLFHQRGAVGAARTGDNVNPGRRSSGTQFYIVSAGQVEEEQLIAAEERINIGNEQLLYSKIHSEERDRALEADTTLTEADIIEIATNRVKEEMERSGRYQIDETQHEVYRNIGGAPHLDNHYTVFGQVVEGLDIVEAIENADITGSVPTGDVRILNAEVLTRGLSGRR